MRDGAFSLTAPPVQGMPVQTRPAHPARRHYRLQTSHRHRTARYEVRLEPRMALYPQPPERHLPEPDGAANVENPARAEPDARSDFVFNLKSEYPAREQVMQYGEDDLTFVPRLLSRWVSGSALPPTPVEIEVIEFYDDQAATSAAELPLHPSGLFDGETEAVWGLNTAYSVVEKVFHAEYNYRKATAEMTTGPA